MSDPEQPANTAAAQATGAGSAISAGADHGAPQPTHAHGAIELGELLRQYRLGLVLIAGAEPGATLRPVQWVHVSELEDPTPFLPPRTVLLTTGARFEAARSQARADAYVQRLIDAGTAALGVAVGLHWERIPPRFVSACDRLGLPLFRVPYDTPFIAIVQAAARLLEAQSRERDLWALDAQRAVTNASLHRDGLGSAVREAAGRLGRWVAITDRSGRLIELEPASARQGVQPEWIRREVRRLVERGVNAGRIGGDEGIRMQVLGRQGRALGVLVVEDHGAPDHAERALLGLVAALATVQLEHRSGLEASQAVLREGVVRLLISGEFALAEKLAVGAISRIPREPVVVARFRSPGAHGDSFLEDLRSLDASTPGFLRASLDDEPLILTEVRHLPMLRRLLLTHEVASGLSERGTLRQLDELIGQADRALEYAASRGIEAPLDHLPALHDGVLHLLNTHPEARRRAESLLAPIRTHDRKHDDGIERSLRVWLSHNGLTSPAAEELGVHRHTLRSRVQTAGNLLQTDLDSPDTRAELWAALRLTGEEAEEAAD